MLSAIIVAGGSSTRMGFDKLFATIAGRAVIVHSIAAFQEAACVKEIVVVARDEVRAAVEKLVQLEVFSRVRAVVRGGERRHDSVRAGLGAISESATHVAVHDAARPLIDPVEIERVYRAALTHGAAALAAPINETVKRASPDHFVTESVDRSSLFAMQTPQIFERLLIARAYDEIERQSLTVTDEVSAVQIIGHRVALVMSERPNPKITFAGDLALAECVLAARS